MKKINGTMKQAAKDFHQAFFERNFTRMKQLAAAGFALDQLGDYGGTPTDKPLAVLSCTPLYAAVELGDVELVRFLLEECGANVQLGNYKKNSPLHVVGSDRISTNSNYWPIIRKAGIKTEEVPASRPALKSLHYRVHYDHKQMFETLIKHGADVYALNVYGMTPFENLIYHEIETTAHYLLDIGAHPFPGDRQIPGAQGRALPLAAAAGFTRLVQRLLELGDDPASGLPRLAAKDKGHLEIHDMLKAVDGLTPLHLAVIERDEYEVKSLLAQGACSDGHPQGINPVSGRFVPTPLFHALGSARYTYTSAGAGLKIARLLLEAGANPEIGERPNLTPRYLAEHCLSDGRFLKLFDKARSPKKTVRRLNEARS